jgi:alkylhydroperoxidase/carboxymuconolactone decarboxylase family protein YurZ
MPAAEFFLRSLLSLLFLIAMHQRVFTRLSPKTLVLAAAAMLASTGCTDGYSAQDAISSTGSTATNTDEHIRALNGHLRETTASGALR